jgi:hypothetical protein
VLKDSLGLQVNSSVVIVSGKYKDMEAVILEINGDSKGDRKFTVELVLNGQTTKVHESRVVPKEQYTGGPSPSIQKNEAEIYDEHSRSRSRSNHKKPLRWVTKGLIVKIKRKSTHYNKKVITHITARFEYTMWLIGISS